MQQAGLDQRCGLAISESLEIFAHLWIEIELPRQVVPIRKDADMLCAARNPALLLISMRDVRPERISAMPNLQDPGVSR